MCVSYKSNTVSAHGLKCHCFRAGRALQEHKKGLKNRAGKRKRPRRRATCVRKYNRNNNNRSDFEIGVSRVYKAQVLSDMPRRGRNLHSQNFPGCCTNDSYPARSAMQRVQGSTNRGGITRSNGKCSKKVAIMDKDLNGNWSNGKCPNWK